MSDGEHAHPFLTLHIGQAGVQIGSAIWELLCLEHNISPSGSAKPECPSNGFYDAMFMKNSTGHFMPRSLFVDTDPTCIDEVRVGPYRELFSANQLLSDYNDAKFNYMLGRHGYSKRLVPDTVENFRWLLEKADIAPTSFLIHGVSGGTGSGLAASFLEALNGEHGSKLQVLELSVSSGRSGLQNSCELMNSVLYQYESRDFTRLSFSVTNSAMYSICRSGLGLTNATYAHVNRMLAMCFSNFTAMERFPGTMPCSVDTICSNVLPFKQLKNPVLACAPFSSVDMVGKERLNTVGVTSAVMEPDVQLADLDLRQGQHMAGVLLYRGAAKPSDVEQALASIRGKGKVDFVEWAPASFKTGLIELPPLAVPSSGIGGVSLSVTLVSNHTGIASLFRGQSESIRKLSVGGYFLHNYESGSAGPSGHNSSIRNLLTEACEHMEGMAKVYESKLPPEQALQGVKKPRSSAVPDDGSQQKSIEKSPVGKRSSSASIGEQSIVPARKKSAHQEVALASLMQTLESHPDASDPYAPQMASDEGTSAPIPSTPPSKEAYHSEEAAHPSPILPPELPSQAHPDTDVREEVLLTYTEQEQHEGSMTPTSTADSTVTLGHRDDNDTHSHSTPATTSEVHERVVISGKKHQKKKCSKCCEEGGKCASCCKKGGGRGGTGGKKEHDKKDGSCCKKDGKRKNETNGGKDSSLTVGRKKDGTSSGKTSGTCCKKDGSRGEQQKKDKTQEARSQSECCKKRNVKKNHGTPLRSQSQNHANSAPRYLADSTSTADGMSCRSANCVDAEWRGYQRAGNWFHESSSASTPSADSAEDFNEIVQNCLPGPLSISRTISSVRQIIQKYNEIFASDAKGTTTSPGWSAK